MRVLPLLRGMIGAVTVIVWALMLSDPILYNFKNQTFENLHRPDPSAAQPFPRNASSRLALSHDERAPPDERADKTRGFDVVSRSLPGDKSGGLSASSEDSEIRASSNGKEERESTVSGNPEPVTAAPRAVVRSPSASSPYAAAESEGAGAGPFSRGGMISRDQERASMGQETRTSSRASPDTSPSTIQASREPTTQDATVADTSLHAGRDDQASVLASVLPEPSPPTPNDPLDRQDRSANASAPPPEAIGSTSPASALPPMPDFADDAQLSTSAAPRGGAPPLAPTLSQTPTASFKAEKSGQSEVDSGSLRPLAADAANATSPPSSAASSPQGGSRAQHRRPTQSPAAVVPRAQNPGTDMAQSKRNEKARMPDHPPRTSSNGIVDRERRTPASNASSRRDVAKQGRSAGFTPVEDSASAVEEHRARLLSEMRVSARAIRDPQLRLAVRRRCPSIVASAGEYDDDLVRLCRNSAGL